MESNSGLKRLLKSAIGYGLFQNIVGSDRSTQQLVDTYLGDTTGLEIVDIGSGVSHILEFIRPAKYTAIEPNISYLDSASNKFKNRVTPVNLGVGDPRLEDLSLKADVVLILGVLHHLDDSLSKECLRLAKRCLRDKNSKVLILEAALTPKQNLIARLLIKNDRGKNVRTREGYEGLIKSEFESYSSEIRTDLLNIPYTHFISTARL
jgi:SAM-dependent methyltransferase